MRAYLQGRRRKLCLTLLVLAMAADVASQCAFAASMFEFDSWMRKIDLRSVEVQRKLARQDSAGAAAEARELELLYAQMQRYFEDKGNERGAELSRADKERAGNIRLAVDGADYALAESHAVQITQACSGCHELYRPFK